MIKTEALYSGGIILETCFVNFGSKLGVVCISADFNCCIGIFGK